MMPNADTNTVEEEDEDSNLFSLLFLLLIVIGSIGKKHALKRYDQFGLNTSCFWGSSRSNFYTSCVISRNFCYKNNK